MSSGYTTVAESAFKQALQIHPWATVAQQALQRIDQEPVE
jgi:hypothetical protein